jgi:hypothetical protein
MAGPIGRIVSPDLISDILVDADAGDPCHYIDASFMRGLCMCCCRIEDARSEA